MLPALPPAQRSNGMRFSSNCAQTPAWAGRERSPGYRCQPVADTMRHRVCTAPGDVPMDTRQEQNPQTTADAHALGTACACSGSSRSGPCGHHPGTSGCPQSSHQPQLSRWPGTATRHSSVLGHDNQNERIWSRLTAVTRCLGRGAQVPAPPQCPQPRQRLQSSERPEVARYRRSPWLAPQPGGTHPWQPVPSALLLPPGACSQQRGGFSSQDH